MSDDEDWSQYSRAHLEEVQQMMQPLFEAARNRKFSIVLDIGCGSGHLTKYLNENIDCDLLIGIDINERRIDEANKSYGNDRVVFVVCDISKPWDEINAILEQITPCEGRVSFAFCNHLFCAINTDKEGRTLVAQNIHRLLMPKGMVYANYCQHHDGFGGRSFKYWIRYLKEVESVRRQLCKWRKALRSAEFTIVEGRSNLAAKAVLSKKFLEALLAIKILPETEESPRADSFWYMQDKDSYERRTVEVDERSRDGHRKVEYTFYYIRLIAQKSVASNNFWSRFRICD